MRQTYRQHWSHQIMAGLLALTVPVASTVFGIGANISSVVWGGLFIVGAYCLLRPRVVVTELGFTVTQVVGRAVAYDWSEVETITLREAGGRGWSRFEPCVLIELRGRSGLDAEVDLPWLSTQQKRIGPLGRARLQHSLHVAEQLRGHLEVWSSRHST